MARDPGGRRRGLSAPKKKKKPKPAIAKPARTSAPAKVEGYRRGTEGAPRGPMPSVSTGKGKRLPQKEAKRQTTNARFSRYANQTGPAPTKRQRRVQLNRRFERKAKEAEKDTLYTVDTAKKVGKTAAAIADVFRPGRAKDKGRGLVKEAAKAGVKAAPKAAAGIGGPEMLKSPAVRGAVIGPNLNAAITKGEFDPRMAALEAAILPLGIGGKAGAVASRVLRLGRAGKAAKVAAAVPKPKFPLTRVKTITKETPEADVAKRLRKLDREYEKLVKKVTPIVNPYGPAPMVGGKKVGQSEAQIEARLRNIYRKKKPTHANMKNPLQEVREMAEDNLAAFAEKHPDYPEAKIIRERQELRDLMNERGMASIEGVPPPKLPSTTEKITVPTPGAQVRGSLGAMRKGRAEQKRLYARETAERVQAARAAQSAAGGGIEGARAAKGELAGEMPKVKFERLREGNMSQQELDELFRTVQAHPDLQFFEQLRASDALAAALNEGKLPTKSEIKLLQTVFGKDAADELAKISKMRMAGHVAYETLNIPRSLMASFDLSAPFRQALVAGAAHPRTFAKNFAPMIRAMRSEKAYRAQMDAIAERPNFELYEQMKLALTEHGAYAETLAKREEQFPSAYAEKIPLAGRGVSGSSRAFTGFLNTMRADVADILLDVAKAEGVNIENTKFLRDLGRYINSATGRGPLKGSLENAAPALNTLFFSPRLIASRIDLLGSPVTYMAADPFVRKQALKSMIRLAGAASTVLGLAAYAGAKVGLDPRSADFAKIRIGDTRLDVLGGFQQYIRLIAQMTKGEIVSSATGDVMTLGPGFGQLSRWDIAERFVVGKFAPPPSFIHDFFKGTDFEGQPFDVKKATLQRMVPFIAQDLKDLWDDTHNVAAVAGVAGMIGVGFGVQTYSNPKVTRVQTAHKDYGDLMAEGIRKTGLGKGLTPQLKKALDVRQARYENRQAEGADDIRERFEADVNFLADRDLIDDGQAAKAIKWVHGEKRDFNVEKEMRLLSDHYFDDLYGDALADAKEKLRDKGYDLPRLPRG